MNMWIDFGQFPNMTANNVRMEQDIINWTDELKANDTPQGGNIILCTLLH